MSHETFSPIDEPTNLRVRASELRRQGFSYSQIGRRLGIHFYKAQIDGRLDKSIEKCGKLSFGTVHVAVTGQGVVKLHHRIMGLLTGFGEIIEQTRD